MKKRKFFNIIFFMFLILPVLFMTSNTAFSSDGYGGNPYNAIDDYIRVQMEALNIPGAALLIVKDDVIMHQNYFGESDTHGNPPTPQTPFFIGSLTKSITAFAVMQLVSEGKIDPDSPVINYLPWFRTSGPGASSKITVRHLLNQTSGLSEASGRIPLADFDNSPGAAERAVRGLSGTELIHPPGTAFEYSNSNYNILGLVIEAAGGEPYSNYIREHVFLPLGMLHSTSSKEEAMTGGLATGHRYSFSVPAASHNMKVPAGSLASGQLISTAEDMGHYMTAMLNGGNYNGHQIIPEKAVGTLLHGEAESFQMGMSFGKYAMGWFIDDTSGETVAWHTGIVPDYFSYMALLPERKTGVILLFNGYNYMMTPALSETGAGVTSILIGRKPEQTPAAVFVWTLRAMLLVPLMQIFFVVTSLRAISRWRRKPELRPAGFRKWLFHIIVPAVPHLLTALMLIPILGAVHGFWRLYFPDFYWTGLVCGTFALIWIFIRTVLVLPALQPSGLHHIDITGEIP